MNYEYLQDYKFLKALDIQHSKRYFNKINVLDNYDRVIAELECRIKDGGNTSINGNSAVRRQSSLTAVIPEKQEADIRQVYSLFEPDKQIEILTGIENNLKNQFPQWKDLDIIWFPMGRFILTTPSFKNSSAGIEVSLQLSDKMAIMNGECGGVFPADVELSYKDDYIIVDEKYYDWEEETGNYYNILKYAEKIPVPMKQMVMEIANHWGGEQIPKILVDIPEQVKTVKRLKQGQLELHQTKEDDKIYIGSFIKNENNESSEDWNDDDITIYSNEEEPIIFNYYQDIGFMYEDFTYPDSNGLIGTKGSNAAAALESIKTALGNYEFFYDKFGNFIFQEIKNYLNTSQSMDILDVLTNENSNIDYTLDRFRNKSVYIFNDSQLIESYSNNPQYNLIKNDFIIWGKKSNDTIIRYHLSLDENPIKENMIIEDISFLVMPIVEPTFSGLTQDYYTSTVVRALSKTNEDGMLDVYYYDNDDIIYRWNGADYIPIEEYLNLKEDQIEKFQLYKDCNMVIPKEDWRTQLFLQGVIAEPIGDTTNYYYTELKTEWPKIIDVKKLFNEELEYNNLKDILINDLDKTQINYFLDILDTSNRISKYKISNIGRRTEVLSNDKINCIFENDIPSYVYIKTSIKQIDDRDGELMKIEIENHQDEINMIINQGYAPVFLYREAVEEIIDGGKLNSAYEAAKDLLYRSTGYNEKISLSVLPIYYLEPNTRITVNDTKSMIQGDYIIDNIDIPLNGAGMMNLSCSRALDKL